MTEKKNQKRKSATQREREKDRERERERERDAQGKTASDRLLIMWKSDLSDKIKREFF